MNNQNRNFDNIRDLLRLVRVEDYGTFVQLIIGYLLAGGRDGWYLMSSLAILAPCVYGGLYALNDVHDAIADRQHPLKCTRPIAAGRIDSRSGFLIGVSLISVGIVTALVFDFKILVLTLLFVGINLAYTFKFKSVPYLEIALNTITHPLRFAAGLWLAGIWVHWPLLITWTLATFAITTLKRVKEMRESSSAVRPVLHYYNEANLMYLITFSLVLLIGVLPFTTGACFILTGIWFTLTLVTVVGYFSIPTIKQLEEHLWR